MGISTSGSLLIIFLGAFIALGTAYTVASNTTDEFTDAYSDELATQDEIVETAVSVEAVYHEADGNLTVRADNEGSADLSVSETDVLIDGTFSAVSGFEIQTVDDRETDLWQSGEQLRLENESAEPDRAKVVTGSGVAATAQVEAVTLANESDGTLNRTDDESDSTIVFEVESTYPGDVTLQTVTVEAVDKDVKTINHEDETLNITRTPDHEVRTEDESFNVSKVIDHEEMDLAPEETARYQIGAFRDDEGDPVAMTDTTVTIAITFEDPRGVERTFTFEESDF